MRCLVLLLAASACAAEERKVLYERKVVPPTWNFVARASDHHRMHFLVAVKQQNLKVLEEKFWAVADPKSKDWQHFMTKEEISKIVAARAEDMDTVKNWITSVTKDAVVTESADAVEVRCSAADAERLFDAQIYMYVHDNGHVVLRTMGKHSVPIAVAEAIDFIEGIADFPMHRSSVRRNIKAEATATQALVAPQTLLEMYSVPSAKVSKVSEGPAEFQDDTSYNKEDLKTFFKETDLADETVSDIVGPYDGATPDTEATLDVQYITSVGEKQVNWYWTADNWMYQWSHNFFNAASVPDEASISWGWAEDQQCSSGISQPECKTLGVDSEQYVSRVNVEFQKIGLRGVSLFVASGDSGANGRSDGTCTDKVLHASFPGSSPYVTTVGATMLQDPKYELKKAPAACSALGTSYKCASGGLEVAVSSSAAGFTSGGGFSTYSTMPSYQKAAVVLTSVRRPRSCLLRRTSTAPIVHTQTSQPWATTS
jgi:tripeptidyl-peptidase-1